MQKHPYFQGSHHARWYGVLDVVVHPLAEGVETAKQLVGPLRVLAVLVVSRLHRRERSLSPHVRRLLLHEEVPLDLRTGVSPPRTQEIDRRTRVE